jgi:hypothetical protein
MLILNGLRIATDGGGEALQPAADLLWRTRRVDSLPPEPEAGNPIAIVRGVRTEPGATDHIFGYDGRVRCRFRIGPDGSAVGCRALPEVSDRDLFSLFAEPVMRTVLVRRGLISFHAAALARNGRSILIMADKGAGKSTLSWALQAQGWQLLADDLARVDLVDGRWSVFSGHRQTKLTPAMARAFGHPDGDIPARFDDSGPAAYAALFDKRVIDAADRSLETSAPVPLAALLFLGARDASAEAARAVPAPPPLAVRQLFEHATPDPLTTAVTADPAMQRAVGGLAGRVRALALTLPDNFDRLAEAARSLGRMALDGEVRA